MRCIISGLALEFLIYLYFFQVGVSLAFVIHESANPHIGGFIHSNSFAYATCFDSINCHIHYKQ